MHNIVRYDIVAILPATKFSKRARFPISEGISPLSSLSPVLKVKYVETK